MEEIYDYCTACLITNVKMYCIHSVLFTEILQILRVSLNAEVQCTTKFCFDCAGLIQKFAKFALKCRRAQNIMFKIKQDNYFITKEVLQSINRRKHNLISTISITKPKCFTINENYVDIIPKSTEEMFTNEIKPEVPCNIEVVNINLIKDEEIDQSSFDDNGNDLNQGNGDFDLSTTEIIPKKYNIKGKKEHKSKKRKRQLKNNDSTSDDEPLANKVTKRNNKDSNLNGTGKKPNSKHFDMSFFEDYANVVFLTPEDAKKELLLRKESSNYMNSPFKCEFCFRGYEAKTAFENHMNKHSSDYGKYECDICHLRFPEQRCLCKHRLASHKRKFCCLLCPYVCFCTDQAKTHVSLHKGKKYPCKECGEIFSMPNSLLMHRRQKHVTQCVCDTCGDTFVTSRGLYSHRMKVHRQDKNEKLGPKCDECNLHFATEEAWKRHLVLSSKHNVSNGCKYCGETFSNADDLKSHVKVHARKHARADFKLPTNCNICNKLLVDRSEFKSHMTSAHPHSEVGKKLLAELLSPFVCELCGLSFKKQCYLTYHQRKHTGARPYSCRSCKKTFQQSGSLAAHRATHGRRKHTCTLCQHSFTFNSALNKHMKVHLNIRPHKCDICDKRFINPCDVRLHVKCVHNNLPWPKRQRKKDLESQQD